MIRNDGNEPVGLLILVPLHRESLPLLKENPISEPYFSAISEIAYQNLTKHSKENPAGWFLLHVDQWLDHGPAARTAFFQFMMLQLMKPGLFLHASPLRLHHDVMVNLGFRAVPGAERRVLGEEFLSRMYELDLRGEHFLSFMQSFVKTRQQDSGAPTTKDLFQETEPNLGLTPRESEIVELALQGLTNPEIAKQLYVSEITVKKHLGSVYEKLVVKGKMQLMKKLLGIQ